VGVEEVPGEVQLFQGQLLGRGEVDSLREPVCVAGQCRPGLTPSVWPPS
jgi:hypothetical protein